MWQIVCLSACVQASIWLCEQLILLSQLDWSRQGSEYTAIRTTSSARDPTVELMKCPSRGGGRESCKGQWHFPSRGDVRGSKSGFCLRVCVCVCSSSQGQARGESDATNQWCGRRWERHKHSQLSQPFLWGIMRSERGRITSTVGRCFSFFFFF